MPTFIFSKQDSRLNMLRDGIKEQLKKQELGKEKKEEKT
jgi:hypothetical protein